METTPRIRGRHVAAVERELTSLRRSGVDVPPTIAAGLRSAAELLDTQRAADPPDLWRTAKASAEYGAWSDRLHGLAGAAADGSLDDILAELARPGPALVQPS